MRLLADYSTEELEKIADKFRSDTSGIRGTKDKEYIAEKGLATIRKHAEDFVAKRLAPAVIPNDGNQRLVIDEELIEEFTELEAVQFDHCNPYYKNRVWGLFGEQDTLAHFSPLFLEHYNQAFHFPGGHTPTEQEVKTWYAPLAQKMLMEFSANF